MQSLTLVKRAEHVAWSRIDGEAILLNLNTGFYYTLNEIGCDAWQLLDTPRSIQTIARKISAVYAADIRQIEQDLFLLFRHMQQEDLLFVVKRPE